MGKKITTSGLKPEKLAEILNIGSEDQSKDASLTEDQKKAELLQDRLSETLLAGSIKSSPLRKELDRLCTMAGIASSEPIRNLLNNPQTDMDLIKMVKKHGEKISSSASCETEHETANVVYYAAIASALIFHHEKITRFSYKDLEEAFRVFIETEWISSDLITLFEKAAEYCHKQVKNG